MTEITGGGNQPPEAGVFEQYQNSNSHSVTISDVYERIDAATEAQRLTKGEIRDEWTQEIILKEMGFNKGDLPEIRCFAEVAKGSVPKAVLSLYLDQDHVVPVILNPEIHALHFIYGKVYAGIFVRKGNEIKRREITLELHGIMPSHRDNLVISQALADELQIGNTEEIFIESVYQKISDINLDQL